MSLQKRTCIFSACLLAALSILAFGQSTSGELVGTIYDQAGAVVPDAAMVANQRGDGHFGQSPVHHFRPISHFEPSGGQLQAGSDGGRLH